MFCLGHLLIQYQGSQRKSGSKKIIPDSRKASKPMPRELLSWYGWDKMFWVFIPFRYKHSISHWCMDEALASLTHRLYLLSRRYSIQRDHKTLDSTQCQNQWVDSFSSTVGRRMEYGWDISTQLVVFFRTSSLGLGTVGICDYMAFLSTLWKFKISTVWVQGRTGYKLSSSAVHTFLPALLLCRFIRALASLPCLSLASTNARANLIP